MKAILLNTAAAIALATAAMNPGSALAGDGYPAATHMPSIWTGFYLGVNAGGNWNQFSEDGTKYDINGATFGGHIGYLWQSGRFVGGLEVDAAALDAKNSWPDPSGVAITTKMSSLVSVRGKAGVAFGNTFVYGTGGVGFARGSVSASANGTTVSVDVSGKGYVLGAGLEQKFGSRFSGRIEGLYYGFNELTVSSNTYKTRLDGTVLRAGVSYHFN